MDDERFSQDTGRPDGSAESGLFLFERESQRFSSCFAGSLTTEEQNVHLVKVFQILKPFLK